jgi:hypothetical protein
MDPRARYRYRTHSVLPLSDHAGFDDLERYVIESGAKKVYTLYGDNHFASHLRQMGIDAKHMHEHGEHGGPVDGRRKAKKKAEVGQTLSLFDLIESSTS